MATERIMADAGTPTEARPALVIANSSGHITETRPIGEDPLLTGKIKDKIEEETQPGSLQRAEKLLDHYTNIPLRGLSPDLQAELQRRRALYRSEADEIRNDLELEGRAGEDPLLTARHLERIRQEIIRSGGTFFAEREAYYDHYASIPRATLTDPQLRTELEARRGEYADQIIALRNELRNAPPGSPQATIYKDTLDEALDFMKKARMAPVASDRWEADRGQVIRAALAGQEFSEVAMFNESLARRELEGRYGGLPSYLFRGVALAIEADSKNRQGETPLNPLAVDEYARLKQRREKDRMYEAHKYTIQRYMGQVYYEFRWPERPKDLPITAMD